MQKYQWLVIQVLVLKTLKMSALSLVINILYNVRVTGAMGEAREIYLKLLISDGDFCSSSSWFIQLKECTNKDALQCRPQSNGQFVIHRDL
jgi:hypothetical protein